MTRLPTVGSQPGDPWLEAIEWHERWRTATEADFTPEQILAWRRWIADDAHCAQFDRLCDLLGSGPTLHRQQSGIHEQQPSLHRRQSIFQRQKPVRYRQQSEFYQQQSTPRAHSRMRVALAASVLFACGIAAYALVQHPAFLASLSHFNSQPAGAYSTEVGEVRTLSLEDGSAVTLGADSGIDVDFTSSYRKVTLVRGEGWFKVSQDVSRPFVVSTDTSIITALGTAFVVQRENNRLVVAVTEGSVEIKPRPIANERDPANHRSHSAQTGMTHLQRGEQAILENGIYPPVTTHTDPEDATAWVHGQLAFDGTPLKLVIPAVARYSGRDIRFDQAAGEQLYTGLVLKGQVDNWIQGLTQIFPVRIVRSVERVCVLAVENTAADGDVGCPD